MKRIILMTVILSLSALSADAQTASEAGRIVYLDGEVDIFRNGKIIDWRIVDIGYVLENFDIIETKSDSMAEIEMKSPSGGTVTIIVNSNTVFAVEKSGEVRSAGTEKTALQMMRGSVGVRVQRLAGRESFTVRTETAVMGVRGTSFDIVTSPEGSTLVTCDTGEVSCRDNDGNEVFARPGYAVDKITDRRISAIPVAVEDLMLYREFWLNTRQDVFRSGAEIFIKSYVKQYRSSLPRLEAAYKALTDQRQTLEKYGAAGADAPLGELISAKSKVSPAVVSMRSILPVFEMIYFRLQELKTYHDEGLGRTMIESWLSSEAFFDGFSLEIRRMNLVISDTRYLLKLYSVIHESSGGGPSILDSPLGGGLDFKGF